MAETKTRADYVDVASYLATITDASRRADCEALAALCTEVTGEPVAPRGTSIVGFGTYWYAGSKGKGYDWFPVGFANRKAELHALPDGRPRAAPGPHGAPGQAQARRRLRVHQAPVRRGHRCAAELIGRAWASPRGEAGAISLRRSRGPAARGRR